MSSQAQSGSGLPAGRPLMSFHIISIFPDYVRTVFEFGVVRRAVEAGVLFFSLSDPREFTEDRHRTTDDVPYGGGPGMVMLAEPLFRAIAALRAAHGEDTPVIYLSPAGEPLTQALAAELAEGTRDEGRAARDSSLILLCGRYEGVDQRLLDEVGAREVSIGDYVLSGGELAAMVLIDAVARLLPGVLGNEASSGLESFCPGRQGEKLLDWPHFTRPEIWRGRQVPAVLLSGNHAKIAGFREDAALVLTYRRRPDLLTPELRQRAEWLMAREEEPD